MTGKRALIYISILLGLGLLLWSLLPPAVPADDEADPRADRPHRARQRDRSGLLPALPGGDREPELLTRVQGRVLDATSAEPVSEVQLAFRSDASSGRALSDGSGIYRLELPGGSYRVTFTSATHVATERAVVQVEAGSPVRWLDFKLQRLASVAGRVVGPDGTPLADVTVRPQARRPGLRTPGDRSKTDARGRFTIKVPPGEAVLRADAGARGAALSTPLYLRPGAHLEGVTIQLGPGLTLTGKVVGPGRQRVSGAQVVLKDELGPRRLACNAEGEFVAGGLAPGIKQLQASADEHSPSPVTRINLAPGKPVHLVLQVTAAKGVGGQVLDPQGQPLGGIEVSVRPGGPGSRVPSLAPPASTTTTADGRFMFTRVPDAPLLLLARGPGNRIASRAGVAPGTYDTVLRLQDAGSIVGTVTAGDQGAPVRDFTVAVLDAQGTGAPRAGRQRLRVVSPSGAYTLADLLPGTYRLSFTAPGYGAQEQSGVAVVAGHNSRVNVVLYQAGSVSGVVVDPRGVGLPGARVTLDTGWLGQAVVTDAEGSFTLHDVARGRRSLTARHVGYDTRIVSGISVFAGQPAEVRVELTPKRGQRAGMRLSGIGVIISQRQGTLTVLKTLEGSPADLAGLRAGDRILAVDGRTLALPQAMEAIRGLVGTPVHLRLERDGRSFDLQVVRAEVSFPSKGG